MDAGAQLRAQALPRPAARAGQHQGDARLGLCPEPALRLHNALVVRPARGDAEAGVRGAHHVRRHDEDVRRALPPRRLHGPAGARHERDLRLLLAPRQQQRHRLLHGAHRRAVVHLPLLPPLPLHALRLGQHQGGDRLPAGARRRDAHHGQRHRLRLRPRDPRHQGSSRRGQPQPARHAQVPLRRLPALPQNALWRLRPRPAVHRVQLDRAQPLPQHHLPQVARLEVHGLHGARGDQVRVLDGGERRLGERGVRVDARRRLRVHAQPVHLRHRHELRALPHVHRHVRPPRARRVRHLQAQRHLLQDARLLQHRLLLPHQL
mmetsp:Transcript_12167/g.40022  ORF Transcript_12167/g.40022 Transcript_12167/m.40022 type:complete len:320 (+) Transcript_12167:497-1456(+)